MNLKGVYEDPFNENACSYFSEVLLMCAPHPPPWEILE